MADEEIKIISRPSTEPPEQTVKIISRPKQAAAEKAPSGFLDRLAAHYQKSVNEGLASMREGSAAGAQAIKEKGFNPLATPGGAQMLGGAAKYIGAPIEAATQTILGDPVRTASRNAGAPPWLQEMLGETANIGGQFFGAAPAARVAREAPAMAREAYGLVKKGGEAAAPIVRGAVNTVDDIIKNQMAQAGRRKAEKAATAAPSREALQEDAGKAFKEAEDAGANVKPEAFATFVDNVPAVLKANKITSGDIPMSEKIYTQTKDLVDRLEDYRGHTLTLENLQILQQEANRFVKNALLAAQGDRGAQDYRAATILSRQIKDFVQNINPEQIVSGDPAKAIPALNRAKELWRRQSKMEEIENIIDVAKRINKPGYVQQQFVNLAKDDIAFRQFSPAEQKIISEIASPSRASQALDLIPGVGKVKKIGKVAQIGEKSDIAEAQKLMDMIARGEGAQAAPQGPSFGQQINDILRPGPPNSANRRLP